MTCSFFIQSDAQVTMNESGGAPTTSSRQRNTRLFKPNMGKLFLSVMFLAGLAMVRNSTRVLDHVDSATWIDSAPSYFSQNVFSLSERIFNGPLVWNDTGSNTQHEHDAGSRSRISYVMRRNASYNMTFSQATPCNMGVSRNKWKRQPKWREPLLESLQPLLNFTTTIRTHLNILVMGDSVGIQFGQLLEEALGANASSRTRIHESWAGNEGVTISRTLGGGALANYRITGMFLAKGEGQPLPNAFGGGWNRSHVEQLLQHPHNLNRQGSFDVMIFRIPHGWLTFEEITEAAIHETIQLANAMFGIRNVILIDIPHTNNIMTVQDLDDRKQTNLLLQEIAAAYPHLPTEFKSNGRGVEEVAVLKFARWTDHLMEYIARVIGLVPSNNEVVSNKSYTLDRLGCRPKFPLSIAQGCAEWAKAGDCQCRRNRITEDGQHWCMESIGGRLVAGIACLMSCFQPATQESSTTTSSSDGANLRDCEQQCNNRFMSLGPLDFQDGAVFG